VKVGATGRPFIRFGVFELDLGSGELRKSGVLIHLPPQPFKILALLASRAGQLVTREQIDQQIWGNETFVDFEQGLNHCIKQIRTVLGDDAESPHYIETLPRRGYRFIAPIETIAPVSSPATSVAALYERRHLEEVEPAVVDRRYSMRARALALAAGGLVALVATLIGLNVAGLRERVFRAVGAAREPPLQIQSIAVLPLENLSGDPAQEYFADGMTDELITDLGQISALRVISRTSVMRYKGTKKSLGEIARELNVDAVVEGMVLRSGERVRITANLLHAPTDRHLWAETYERDLRDVLALQSEVAQAITREIRTTLTPGEHVRLTTTRPVNPEAYELYLKGIRARGLARYEDREGWFRVKAFFQQAIAKDPSYAPAYVALASCYNWAASAAFLPYMEASSKAKALARRCQRFVLKIVESISVS
jgi:TolB-like protein/DNA-binding winged helix-turn-helix (wHTH) protein